MTIYNKERYWKYLLLLLAIGIGASSIYFTNKLSKNLEIEERKKIELWSEATRNLVAADVSNDQLNFLLKVIQNNTNIPVILADEKGTILSYRNLDSSSISNDSLYLKKEFQTMKKKKNIIKILVYNNNYNYIYYNDSYLLKQLIYFPYIQLLLAIIFILIAYFAFSSARNAEQNQVWVGLSKETAHQLGTPTSSLLAWIELFKEKNIDPELTNEMGRDVKRLEVITSRFSNIGSKPILKETNINDVIDSSINYLQSRVSGKITFTKEIPSSDTKVPLNVALFEWVIENICKNAIDAMGTEGSITIKTTVELKRLFIDISDSGKGIPRSKFKTIFKPGYTTKSRGWGLGLSLAKRIIEQYHFGRIFVLSSELNKGTTIRIELKK